MTQSGENGNGLCAADLAESTVTVMSCPQCDSHNVTCESDRRSHRHECHDCGLLHEWKAVPDA